MGELYHGSPQENIKRLEPRKSTHGTYVYATPYKELSIIFSGRCGDDQIYSLFRNDTNEPWQLVERVPNGFETCFNNESSIYTINDSTFKDIHTGFAEVVSEEGVDVLKEEKIKNVYESIINLQSKGLVKTYTYPSRPKDIPYDDSDLINKALKFYKINNKPITKDAFERILYLHPNLLNDINKRLEENGLETYSKNDIINIFENHLVKQILDPNKEEYIKSSSTLIKTIYPELAPSIENDLKVFDKDKNGKINFIADYLLRKFPDIPKEFIIQGMEHYSNDNRSFSEIREELKGNVSNLVFMENISSKEIPKEITDNSVLMIGPMGSGKSTVSDILSSTLNISKISLDDRQQLSNLYSQQDKISGFKEFEFYLTSSVLTNMNKPCVIDFGAGHSIYENPLMFYEMKKIITKFPNVVYMLPSESKEESIKILNDRVLQRNPNESLKVLDDNRHFIDMSCNEQLATIKEYTKDKKPEEVSFDVLEMIKNSKYKDQNNNEEIQKEY